MSRENVDNTSYGVARLPYTSRLARRRLRSRAGWKATAITPVATTVSNTFGSSPEPTSVPTPTTMAR